MKRLLHRLSVLAGIGVVVFLACWWGLPFPEARVRVQAAGAQLTDQEGELLREQLSVEEARCLPIRLEDAGKWLPLALIAAEDKRFFSHPGVDLAATSRAAFQNTVCLRRISGASTISTQVIRLAEPRRRTLKTKVIEYFRALQMEDRWSKREVLEQYLNRTPYGGNLIGVRAASLHYFGREPATLCLEEAALLAGLPQAPTRLRPDRNPQAAKERRDFVLSRLSINGVISEARCRQAIATPIRLAVEPTSFRAPHFCDWLAASLGPGQHRSTLDLDLQQSCERQLVLGEQAWQAEGLDGAAVVVIHVPSGELRAMVGGTDYDRPESGQVNGAVARRSPGSTLKPFIYARAFDRGWLTPQQMLADVPTSFAGYQPENFQSEWRGAVSAREALADSLNLPVLQVAKTNGLRPTLRDLQALGLDTLDQSAETYGLNLVLGGCELRLLDLANAYACMARGGSYKPLRMMSDDPLVEGQRWCSPEAAWLVQDCLRQNDRTEPSFSLKTGTSARHRDAWTVAWNSEFVVGVWLGRLDGRPMSEGVTGRTAAQPIATAVMHSLLVETQGSTGLPPEGIESRACCPISGEPHGAHCPPAVSGWAICSVSDPTPCQVHCRAGRSEWPAEIQDWLQRDVASSSLRMIRPQSGEHFALLDSTQVIQLEAEAAGTVFWFANGQPIGSGRQLVWAPAQDGRIDLLALCENGRRVETRIHIERIR